jgi:hypothetical protein
MYKVNGDAHDIEIKLHNKLTLQREFLGGKNLPHQHHLLSKKYDFRNQKYFSNSTKQLLLNMVCASSV